MLNVTIEDIDGGDMGHGVAVAIHKKRRLVDQKAGQDFDSNHYLRSFNHISIVENAVQNLERSSDGYRMFSDEDNQIQK